MQKLWDMEACTFPGASPGDSGTEVGCFHTRSEPFLIVVAQPLNTEASFHAH